MKCTMLLLLGVSLGFSIFYPRTYQDYQKITQQITQELWDCKLLRIPQDICTQGGTQMMFIVDEGWHRITYAKEDDWIKSWGGYSTGTDGFISPVGIEDDSRGYIYVADYGNGRIVKLKYNVRREELEYVTQFEVGPPGSVWDICNNGDKFYVSDPLDHRINVLDESGTIIFSCGQYGQDVGCFKNPQGIAVFGCSIYVADTYNRRIVWLEDVGDHLEWRGCRYLTEWKYVTLAGVETDADGHVYVVDRINCHILHFSPNLIELLDVFGSKGYGVNQFFHPHFLHIDGNDVIISEEWTDNSGLQFYGIKPGISACDVLKPIFDATEDHETFFFKLDATASVTLTVRNSYGGLVKEIVSDSIMELGEHYVTWDGKSTSEMLSLPGYYSVYISAESPVGSHEVSKGFYVKGTIIEYPGVLSTDEHWIEESEPYVLTCDVTLAPDGRLTIDPGVKVMPTGNYVISTYTGYQTSNKVFARGSALNPILFTPHRKLHPVADTIPKGFWRGIWFSNNYSSDSLLLDHCTIEAAGADSTALFSRVCQLYVTNTKITKSGQYGIYSKSDYTLIDACVFDANDSIPVFVKLNSIDRINNNTFTDNKPDVIGVVSRILDSDATIHDQGVPYWFLNRPPTYGPTFTICGSNEVATLTIEPGTNLQCDDEVRVILGQPGQINRGKIIAHGDESDPIVITAIDTTKPWLGIHLYSYNPADTSIFEYCEMTYGWKPNPYLIYGPGILGCYFGHTPFVLRNSLIGYSQGIGMGFYTWGIGLSVIPDMYDNTFIANDSFPLIMPANCLRNMAGNTFVDNRHNAIYLQVERINESLLWPNQGVPYIVAGALAIDGYGDTLVSVEIESGNVLKFSPAAGMSVNSNDRLIARGVIFTKADSLPWRGTLCFNNADTSIIDSCTIEHNSPTYDWSGAIGINGTPMTITNSVIANNLSGIVINLNSDVEICNNRICCNENGVWVRVLSSTVRIEHNDFIGNRCAFVSNHGSGYEYTLADSNYWGDPSGPWDPVPDDPLYNPGGRGDSIGAHVWYEPYLSEPVFPHGDTLIQPNGGEMLYCEETYEIRWLTEGLPIRQEVYYTTDFPEGGIEGGEFWQFIDTVASGETRYNWPVPSTPSNRCRVAVKLCYDGSGKHGNADSENQQRIDSGDKEGKLQIVRPDSRPRSGSNQPVYDWKSREVFETSVDISDGNFAIIDTVSPQITINAPNGGEYFIPAKEETIRWQASDNHKLDHFDIYLSTDYGANYSDTIVRGLEAPCTAYVWMPTEENSYLCKVRIVAYDSSSNSSDDVSDSLFYIPVMARSREMTAYNNARRLARNFSTNLHLVYSTQDNGRDMSSAHKARDQYSVAKNALTKIIRERSESTADLIYYTRSTNLGGQWQTPVELGTGLYPSIAINDDASVIGVAWTESSGSRILYRYCCGGQWLAQIYTVCDSAPDAFYSPVALQLTGETMCLAALKTTYQPGSELTQDVLYLKFPYDDPSASYATTIDHWRVVGDDDTLPTIASLSVDYDGCAHLAWEKPPGDGDTLFTAPLDPFDIFYFYESDADRKYNISSSEANSINPSIDCYGGHAYIVWQEETNGYNIFLYKRNYVKFPPQTETDTISQTANTSLYPVSRMGGVVLWAEGDPGEIYGRIWDSKQEYWLDIDNWSNTPEVSMYPQVDAWQSEGGTDIIGCWTEDTNTSGLGKSFASYMPGGDRADILFPSYCLTGGTSMSTPFTEHRDSIVSFEEKWFDYGTDSLVYYLPHIRLNSSCMVRLELYRPETDAVDWKVKVRVNNVLQFTLKLSGIGLNVWEYDIPAAVYYNGDVRIKFERVTGDCILLRRLLLYESEIIEEQTDGFASGPQSAADGPVGSVFFDGIYPNPSKHDARILLNAPQACDVFVALYDVSGRFVEKLYEGRINGVCEIPLACKNYASGVYFVRLEAGDVMQTQKVILLR